MNQKNSRQSINKSNQNPVYPTGMKVPQQQIPGSRRKESPCQNQISHKKQNLKKYYPIFQSTSYPRSQHDERHRSGNQSISPIKRQHRNEIRDKYLPRDQSHSRDKSNSPFKQHIKVSHLHKRSKHEQSSSQYQDDQNIKRRKLIESEKFKHIIVNRSISSSRQTSPDKLLHPIESTLSQSHSSQRYGAQNQKQKHKRNILDFNRYINQMIQEGTKNEKIEKQQQESVTQFHIFKKKPVLSIKDLQCEIGHMKKNKISEKLSRRDVQYYDLYALQDPPEDYDRMRAEGYPYTKLDAKIKEFYGDIAYPDFNQVFKNHGDIVTKQYGKTIEVNLKIQKAQSGGIKIQRIVKEDMIKKNNNVEKYNSKKHKEPQSEDLQLQNLDQGLKNMENEFGKTSAEIAEIFCLVSGRLGKVREYLQYERQQKEGCGSQLSVRSNQLRMGGLGGSGVVTWSFLEDLALKKPEDSPEFQVLIATKGLDEIAIRREFLGATPTFQKNEK